MRPRRTARAVAGSVLLDVAAIGGAICIVLVILAFCLNITLIMFKTGSMSPGIPAGSLALVREIAAEDIAVNDVVTVDRAGELPVTHRVTDIAEGLSGNSRSITLKGDANATEDPAPYDVSTVRIVMASVPGLAYVVVWLSNPWMLAALTLGCATLVTWAFWPRRGRGSRGSRGTAHVTPAPNPAAAPDATRRSLRTPTHAAAVIVIGAVVASMAPHVAPSITEATWIDSEQAAGSFTAMTVPAVTMSKCTVVPGLLGILGSFNVTFRIPAGYTLANVSYSVANNAAMVGASAVSPAVTGPTAGEYVASFSTGLLGLLGTNTYLAMRVTATPSGWISPYQVAHGIVGLAASSSSCTVPV